MNDLETTESETLFDAEFRTEIAKSFVYSAAATAGMVVGFIAVGYGIAAVNDFKAKRAAKKAAKES